MPQPNVDFGGSSNFVSHGKNKKKAASAWDKPADEKKNDGWGGQEGEADGGGAAGGDGGGGDAGGRGDNSGDGGAGDGGEDEWNMGGGKKKKKKNKKVLDDERRKKEEEEEEEEAAEAAETKRREDAEAADAAATGVDPPGTFSWADDAGANANANAEVIDDFGFTTPAAKKKGKKDKKPKVFTLIATAIVCANEASTRMRARNLSLRTQSQQMRSPKLTF